MRLKSVAEYEALTGQDALTPAETKLIAAVREGRPCFLCDPENPALPTSAEDDKTRIRADLLRLLILGGTRDCGLHERGVTLFGGWIVGPLDLAYCTARGATMLHFCRFPEEPRLEQARLQLLSLDNSQLDQGLFAQGARIKGSLFLSTLTATGTVDVNAARIGGQLACAGATLDGKDGMALNAQGVTVGQGFFLRNLSATGTVDVNGAQIGGQLDCTGARLDGKGGWALNAQRLRVTQSLIFRSLGGAVIGRINLIAAHVGDLVDDRAVWPTTANDLILDGFTYDRLAGTAPTTLAARKDWLHAGSHWQGEFRPQPYTQLARVLRQMGHAGEARKVLIEREKLLGNSRRAARWKEARQKLPEFHRELPALAANAFDWCWDRIALWVAGYGQDARRSIVALALLFAIATGLAHKTWVEGSFAPNSAVILASPGWAEATARDCLPTAFEGCDPNPAQTWANTFTASADQPTQGADWDSFNALGYGADLVVPFLDLGQTDAWAPSKDRGNWGWWLWFMRWVLAALGWVVTGLGVAAVTGVMQRNQPD